MGIKMGNEGWCLVNTKVKEVNDEVDKVKEYTKRD